MKPADKTQIPESQEALTDWILTNHGSEVTSGLKRAFKGMSSMPAPEEFVNHVLERCLYNESVHSKLILGIEQQQDLAPTVYCIARNVGREERRKIEKHAKRVESGVEELETLIQTNVDVWREGNDSDLRRQVQDEFNQEFFNLDRRVRRVLRERHSEQRSFRAISVRVTKDREKSVRRDNRLPSNEIEVQRLFDEGQKQLLDRLEFLLP